LECFESDAPSNFASPEIIRLNLIKDPNYDPHDVLIEWLNHEQGTLKQLSLKKQSAHCESGWYYLMYKNDLVKSAIHFWQVLREDCNSFKVVVSAIYVNVENSLHSFPSHGQTFYPSQQPWVSLTLGQW
jgi:hypothetical protein